MDSQAGKKIVLRPKENTPITGEIFLDFEGEVNDPEASESPLRKRTNSISILSSSYIKDSKYSVFGKKSAYFSGKRNQIHLGVGGSHFFKEQPEPFTITIPLLMSEQGASSVVLDKTVFIKGKKFGFSLEIEDNKLLLYVNQLIQKNNGSRTSTILQSRETLPRKEWVFISIFFDTLSNRILLFQDGYQTAVFEATGEDIIGIGFPSEDTSNLILAKSFYGNLDGFHIHRGEPLHKRDYSRYSRTSYSDDTKILKHEGSYVTSPIYESNYSFASLEKLNLEIDRPADTQTAIFFRGDNQKFFEDETKGPKWVSIPDPKNLKNLSKFKYHQWKVWLRADPEGKSIPAFYGMNYHIKEQTPPQTPTNFRVQLDETKDKTVCFLWNSNHEREVQDQGGYMIHFGAQPDRMIGTLFVKSNENKIAPISEALGESNYKNLKLCADENVLVSNIYITDQDEKIVKHSPALSDPTFVSRLERRGPLFQSGITYYFRISAYNKYYNEWEGRDQRSKLSPALSIHFPKEISQR